MYRENASANNVVIMVGKMVCLYLSLLVVSRFNPGASPECLRCRRHDMNRMRDRIRIVVKNVRMYLTSRGRRGGFG